MTQTTNYQLNQWEATDQVKRTDFNADNAKIDAAIAAVRQLALRSRFTKLWEMTLTANSSEITIPLTGVNWSLWDKVHLDLYVMNGPQMQVCYSGSSQSFGIAFHISSPTLKLLPRFTLCPGRSAERLVQGVYGSQCTTPQLSYSELKKLTITGGTLYTGSKFTLWGEE